MGTYITILFILIFFHYLADFPLQDVLARAKNQTNPIPDIPWQQALFAHSFIQAGFVYLATGIPALFVAELVCHAVIDYNKSRGELTFTHDQALHLICKMVWAAVVIAT